MTAREFQEWQAYYRLEPFGRDWEQAGTIAAAAHNSNPFQKRKRVPDQYIPKFRENQSANQIEAIMSQWARQHNRIEAKKRGSN